VKSVLNFFEGGEFVDRCLEVDNNEVADRFRLNACLDAAEGQPLLVVRASSEFVNQLCVLDHLHMFDGIFVRRLLTFLLRTPVVTDDGHVAVVHAVSSD
jgi:hypothetical protein